MTAGLFWLYFLSERDMKRILMIATGGTIASKETENGLAPAVSSQELLACVPEIGSACDVHTVQPFNLDSTNICAAHWLQIARIVEENYDLFDGFVVTHGTDTMAYTAAALSVRIVFDGSVILGTRAKKTRTRSFNAFSSIDFPAVAVMREGKPFYYIEGNKPAGRPVFYRSLNERVFVLKMIPGLRADIFDYLDSHCDGLIIESFGAGGLPNYENDAFCARLTHFLSLGKTAVLTTQVEREGSALDKYAVGRKLRACGRVLEARCMTLEATVAKLMWILSFAGGEEAERLFYTPVERDIF